MLGDREDQVGDRRRYTDSLAVTVSMAMAYKVHDSIAREVVSENPMLVGKHRASSFFSRHLLYQELIAEDETCTQLWIYIERNAQQCSE